ncbi:Iron-regulated protein FrpA [Nymphon striatum]|nr:Iron-regulated protein FrpA [Nymphon striatum]
MATDDYIQRFAEYVAEHLDADLTARVEYSNEIWNGMFEQTQWAQAQAATRFGIDESFYATREFVAARSADMSLIWQDEFGQAGRSADTLEVVISGIGYYDENEIENVLNATRWRAEDPANRADLHLFDAYAANGYFGNEYGNDAYAVAGALLYQQLNPDDPDNTQVVGGLPSLNDLAATWAEISTNLPDDISMIMYEGGTHLVRVSAGENRTNEVVLDQFFLDFNYSDHMTLLYEQLLDNWSAADGELFNAFVDVARPSAFGSWGNLRFLGDSTGRWDELIEYNQTDHGWNSSGAAAYENGETLIGDGAANQLEGGNDADFLLGLSGDDILNGGGGRDGLSGGGGADTLDGQDGTDVLVGGMGDDVLTGGTGGDDFAFATGDGADIITDFLPGQDRLVIDGSIVVDLLAAPDVLNLGLAVDADQNLVISFGAGDSITLLHSDDLEAAYPDLFTPPPIMTVVTGTSGKDTINTNFVDAEGDTITDEGQEIHGEAGSDRIYDGDGDDIVFGGAGNDSFYAGGGADVYDGGAGTDHVRYNYAGPNLIVDMNNPDNNTGIAAGDQYTSVERLSGSNHDDVLHLAAGMVAFGRNGDDIFYDSTGREIMKGSGGADTFVLMAGDGHQDRVVSFQVGQDVLDISSWGASSIDDLNIYQFVSGSGNAQNRAIVEFNGESLSLHSFDPVNIPLLSNDDFIFL